MGLFIPAGLPRQRAMYALIMSLFVPGLGQIYLGVFTGELGVNVRLILTGVLFLVTTVAFGLGWILALIHGIMVLNRCEE